MVRGAVLGAGLLFAVMLAAAPSSLAGARPGERYDGTSATGQRVYLTVSKDGTRLRRYVFLVKASCSDGRRRVEGLFQAGERRVTIAPDGTFAYTSRLWRASHRTPGGRVRGRSRVRFTGTFNAAGDTVMGEIRARFRSRRLSCVSGAVPYSAYVGGSPGAPWRDAELATGLYTARGRGLRVRLRTRAPGRMLMKATIDWRTRCGRGGRLSGGNTYLRYHIPRARLDKPGRGTRRVARGVTASERWRLELRFSQSGGVYRVDGRWRSAQWFAGVA